MKRQAPAAARNAEPIAAVLEGLLPRQGTVLEVASGTGQHAALFAARLAPLCWQPSDADDAALQSIEAYRLEAGLDNLLAPLQLDICAPTIDAPAGLCALVCINMIHISPWAASEGLLRAAEDWLPPQGMLISYGPYRFSGAFTAPSNASFDAGLRHTNPAWGVRDIDDLTALASQHGFAPPEVISMPANNHVLVFRRSADQH